MLVVDGLVYVFNEGCVMWCSGRAKEEVRESSFLFISPAPPPKPDNGPDARLEMGRKAGKSSVVAG